MLVDILVGLVFTSVLIFALRKVYLDAKNNKCHCGTSCSDKNKCSKG